MEEAAVGVLSEVATAAIMMTVRVEVAMASGSATAAGTARTGTRSVRRGGVRVRTNINVTFARSNTVSLCVQFIPSTNTMYSSDRAVKSTVLKVLLQSFQAFFFLFL